MSEPSYPDFEPAWVEDPDSHAWELRWLGKDGKPLVGIGVKREGDVPGLHTPAAANAILAMPLAKQSERLWGPVPAPAEPVQES